MKGRDRDTRRDKNSRKIDRRSDILKLMRERQRDFYFEKLLYRTNRGF